MSYTPPRSASRRPVIGLFGGSFNPPTRAHIAMARHACDVLSLDGVWLLVAPHNPDKPKHTLAPFADRVAMCQLAIAGQTGLAVSTLENDLGTQQTADTLRGIRIRHPDKDFIWLMGADNLVHFHLWDNWQDITQTVPVAVFSRPGDWHDVAQTPFMQAMGPPQPVDKAHMLQPGQWMLFDNPAMRVSATHVRSLLAKGEPSPDILPDVADYIHSHGLYQNPP